MSKSKKILLYIIGSCSVFSVLSIIFLPIISVGFFETYSFNLLYLIDKINWHELFAILTAVSIIIVLLLILNSVFAFLKKNTIVVIFSVINMLFSVIYILFLCIAFDGFGRPGIGTVLYVILCFGNAVISIINTQIGKNSSGLESPYSISKSKNHVSSPMKFYEPENILKSKENIEKTEEKIKSEMPWDSDDSVYDKTSKYFSDVENENSFIGFESFNRFGNNNEDFVFEEETNTMIEKNEELEMPPAFKTKTEKTTDKIEKILTDADEFEAPPPFKTYHMQKAKPIEKTIDEDEFEAPPSFKNTSESKSVSAKFKGSLAKKI